MKLKLSDPLPSGLSMGLCLLVSLWLSLPAARSQTVLPPVNLKCEYLTNPLGVDIPIPRFSWEVGDRRRGAVQSAYQLLVSSSREFLEAGRADVWDSGKVNSSASLQIDFAGAALNSGHRYYWRVRTWDSEGQPSPFSKPAWFEMGLLEASDWQAQWIGDGSKPPARDEDFYEELPAPLFRKDFRLDKPVQRARLYISGLGYHETWLNGRRVGDHRLDPGWTQYGKTVYYVVHDVTEGLSQGANALGVMLGNGWYNPLPMRMFGRWNLREILTIGQPKLIAKLVITFADGTTRTIASDGTWTTAPGPILHNDVYLGEWYDARREIDNWHTPGFNDSGWKKVVPVEAPAGDLRWQYIPPIRHTRTVTAKKITNPQPGVYVADLGQNFGGIIRFRCRAPAGTRITFRYAEILNDDGMINVNTSVATQLKRPGMGGPGAPDIAWQEDRYTCRGGGEETFEPRFTFHGFRYVEITGLPYAPSLNDIEGLRLNSDLERISSFECSNPLFNRIQEITEWAMLSNVFSVESDCPAREKYGYGGDIVTAGEAFISNFDMSSFYVKTARDFARDARSSGGMTECAPDIGINQGGLEESTGPVGWTLAHPFVLEQLYRYYGNRRIIEEQYAPLKKLVDFYRQRTPGFLIMDGIGDHNSVDERPLPVTSTGFYYHHARILAKMAGILGKNDDKLAYTALADSIKAAFIRTFVNTETGEVYTRTQACQVIALYYDLLPENLRRKALDVLLEEIFLRHKGHLSTGIFTTKMMLNYLSDQGRDEVNFTMINQKEYPGYGYMIDKGATTLWEDWEEREHHSKNHPMFGSVSEWFLKSILGIQQSDSSVAFSDIVIRPAVVGDLSWAGGYYHSVRGRIGSHWWKFGDDLHLEVEIPANTRASVFLPLTGSDRPDIYEGRTLLLREGEFTGLDPEIRLRSSNYRYCELELGAGQYHFVIQH